MARHKVCHESFLRKLLEDILFQKQKVTNQNVKNNREGTSAILNTVIVTFKKKKNW